MFRKKEGIPVSLQIKQRQSSHPHDTLRDAFLMRPGCQSSVGIDCLQPTKRIALVCCSATFAAIKYALRQSLGASSWTKRGFSSRRPLIACEPGGGEDQDWGEKCLAQYALVSPWGFSVQTNHYTTFGTLRLSRLSDSMFPDSLEGHFIAAQHLSRRLQSTLRCTTPAGTVKTKSNSGRVLSHSCSLSCGRSPEVL